MRLFVPSDAPTFLSKEECKAIFDRCLAMTKGGGELFMSITSKDRNTLQWARNRAYVSSHARQTDFFIVRRINGAQSYSSTNRSDDASLRDTIRRAERAVSYDLGSVMGDRWEIPDPPASTLNPTLWSDATVAFDADARHDVISKLIAPVESDGMLGAGALSVTASGYASIMSTGDFFYYPTTRVSFSTTVRDAKGTGSGWAGTDDFDVRRIDMVAMAARAADKCRASMNPVAIEPGRYTVILEPQAVADFFGLLATFGPPIPLDRSDAQSGRGPFGDPVRHRTKIGTRVIDPRVSWGADPMDPIGGFLPFGGRSARRAVKWIDNGILRELAYNKIYARMFLGLTNALPNPESYRIEGGSTSMDEMIATTKRGILVTRFHNVNVSDYDSFTCTGYTRDGLWLIENGKISKPIRNFRFTESPLFVFNNLDQIGPAQRVFSGETWGEDRAWVAPAVKAHDFNFTQLADAV